MKVRTTNRAIMDLAQAVAYYLQQQSMNEKHFNYAMSRCRAKLVPLIKSINKTDAENLKEYYAAIGKEKEEARLTKKTPDPEYIRRINERYKADIEKNKAYLDTEIEVELFGIRYAWLPSAPGEPQAAIEPLIVDMPEESDLIKTDKKKES